MLMYFNIISTLDFSQCYVILNAPYYKKHRNWFDFIYEFIYSLFFAKQRF